MAENNSEYITGLNEKHNNIIGEIQELQAVEQYLFQKIQEASSSNAEQTDQDDIQQYIKALITQRKNIYTQLQNLYAEANKNIDDSSVLLGSQATLTGQLQKEIEKARIEEKKLIAQKNNKQRLAQIGEYEYSKNSEHKSVLKTIVYGSFIVLILVFLDSKDIFPTFLTKILIFIVVFITLLLIFQRMFWNFKRNNIDYGKFNFDEKDQEQSEDVVHKNNLTISKLLGLECKRTEEFSLLNSCCKSSKNILPSNLLKNKDLKYSTVN